MNGDSTFGETPQTPQPLLLDQTEEIDNNKLQELHNFPLCRLVSLDDCLQQNFLEKEINQHCV